MRYETRWEKVTDHDGFKRLKLKSGRVVTFSDAESETSKFIVHVTRWLMRMTKLAGTHKYSEYDWRSIERTVDQLESLVEWYRKEIERHRIHSDKRERIAALRNVTGRTPEEAAAFLAKADQLEQELDKEVNFYTE